MSRGNRQARAIPLKLCYPDGRLSIMSDVDEQDLGGHISGFGSPIYRNYVLVALTLVYTLNFIDRTLIAVVAQPIIHSFGLTDAQWGLLYGPPFAIFYAFMGLPIALLADRSNRVKIITVCIVLWSVMTALCGVAAGFVTLLLFRVGVAVGEAGCTPPANSLIGDYFIAKKRASALSIYSTGVMLGAVLANLFGGPIAQMQGTDFDAWLKGVGIGWIFSQVDWNLVEGWRIAFVIVGLPGVLVALMVLFTIKEPPRGYSDPPGLVADMPVHWGVAFSELRHKPTFWWMVAGASMVAFVGYGINSFQAPLLQRLHGLNVRDAAVNFGAPFAFMAAIGTFIGGYITEKLTPHWRTAVAWVPALGLLIATPLYIFAFYSKDLNLVLFFWGTATMCHFSYLGAQYTIGQGVVTNRSRAAAIAVLLIAVSLVGNGLGPYFVGLLSDFFMALTLEMVDLTQHLTPSTCLSDVNDYDEGQKHLCAVAYATGLQRAMSATVCLFAIAAFCFIVSSKNLERDFVAEL